MIASRFEGFTEDERSEQTRKPWILRRLNTNRLPATYPCAKDLSGHSPQRVESRGNYDQSWLRDVNRF